jgi:hypothetical protein
MLSLCHEIAASRAHADAETAARKLIVIANSVEAVQDGRIFIELISGPFLFRAESHAGQIHRRPQSGDRAQMHESGTSVKFTQAGADLFA